MKLQSACFVLGAVLALTAPAWAQSKAIPPTGISTGTQTTGTGGQTATGTGMQTTASGTQTGTAMGTQTTSTSAGAFQNLSPGGQKIAQSLYNAQNPSTGTTKLTLDQIAGLKGKEGWGRVFKEMKADGLVHAKNLGQVVSGHAQMTSTGTTGSTGRGSQASTRTGGRNSTVATSGAGRGMRFASASGRGSGRYAGGYSPHYMSGPGMYAGGMHGGMPGGGFPGGGFNGGGGGGHGHGH